MAEEKLLTVREVSIVLGISEKQVIDLAEESKIPAYKVGGVYLRFRRDQIEEFKKNFKPSECKTDISSRHPLNPSLAAKESFRDKLSDFFYFYDFYILSVLIIALMLVIIIRRY